MDQDLDVYYDAKLPASFGGVRRLYEYVRSKGVSEQDVKKYLASQNTYTLHKGRRFNFPRNRIITLHKDYQWAADLTDLQKYSRINEGYRYLLFVIDTFTKFLWIRPLKNKQPESVKDALEDIMATGRKPLRLRTDRGTEFGAKELLKFYEKNNILYITSFNSTYKAAIAERVQRTIKDRLFRLFTSRGSHKYVDVIQDLVQSYNNSVHRSIKMTPVQASSAPTSIVFRNLYKTDSLKHVNEVKREPGLKTGDLVRVAFDKNVFDKGYWATHADATASVNRVHVTPYPMYSIQDSRGVKLNRRFYEHELQKIEDPKYRIEKVLKTREKDGKTQYYVKFLGYDSSYNDWVDSLESV